MANEKKPSIYDDRGTIGSADELDEYGVWVKSEPQDLSPDFSNIQESQPFSADDSADLPAITSGADDLDPGIPEMDDFPDFGADFDESKTPDESSIDFSDDDFSLPEADEDDAIDEMDIPSLDDSGDAAEPKDEGKKPASTGHEDAADSMHFIESDDGLTIHDISSDGGDAGFTEVSMDDFIGTLDTEPEDHAQAREHEYEHEHAETKQAKPAAPGHQDISTQLLMKIAEELSSIRSELSSLKKEFSGIKTGTATVEEGAKGDFFGEEDDEKISLTGDELNNILNTADFTEEAGADATVDLAEDINLGGAEEPSPAAAPVSSEETAVSQDAEPAEALETVNELSSKDENSEPLDIDISLDDAELDELGGENKLDDSSWNSQAEEDFDISMDNDAAPAEDDEILRISDLDTVNLEEDTETLPEFDMEETDELRQIRENGAEPMTFAPEPEDSDYLASDPMANETENNGIPEVKDDSGEAFLDLSADISEDKPEDKETEEAIPEESIDLSQAVIDEPDLSLDIQDIPLEEPSLEDISISLDLDENAFSAEKAENEHAEHVTEEAEEISVSSDPGTDLSLIPEGFVVESEDALHEDSPAAFDETGEDITVHEEEEEIPEPLLADDDISLPVEETHPDTAAGPQPGTAPDTPAEPVSEKIPGNIKQELKSVLSYMDQLLEALPDDKIEEFAKSEYFDTYKKLFKELGLV